MAQNFIISFVSHPLQTFPDNHLGRLYFSIQYEITNETLSVLIKKIKNLPKCTKESGFTNKSYVK